jgi:hypothetical protein
MRTPLFRCYDPQCDLDHREVYGERFCKGREIDSPTKGSITDALKGATVKSIRIGTGPTTTYGAEPSNPQPGDIWIETVSGETKTFTHFGTWETNTLSPLPYARGTWNHNHNGGWNHNSFAFRAEQYLAMGIISPQSFINITAI